LGILRINLLLFGKYESLKEFLKKVEKSSRLFEIESLNLKGTEPFEIELTLKTFYLQK